MGQAWSVEAGELALAWEAGDDSVVRLASLRAAGREWVTAAQPAFGEGNTWSGVTASPGEDGLTLIGAVDQGGLALAARWTAYPDHAVLVGEIEVRNEGGDPLTVGSLPSLTLAIGRASGAQVHTLTGGRWDEAMPPRAYRLETREAREIGRVVVGHAEDGRSTAAHVPWLALTHPDGGILASLAWSGRWRLTASRSGDDVLLSMGIADFARELAPGEVVELPPIVLHGFTGDLDDAANTWRNWVTAHWMPPVPEDWPWVQYNHWYAYAGDIDETRLYEEAVIAAEAGAEVFVIDDGWFRGRRPDSYYLGWGDWHEDPAKFPGGLKAFGDRIRALGMRFGLWVEPERADDTGALVRDHPDYVARRDGEFIYRPNDGNHAVDGARQGVHLCLGNPDVQRWMIDDMVRVVRDYGVDWLKWDYNLGYGLGCNATGHGHQAGDGHHAHTLGLYRVLAELRAACPDLVLENCASGGHRMDLGTLRHTHTNWVSDYTHRAVSCRQHAQGAGMVLPLAHLNTWVLNRRDAYEFRSRMGGAFGFSDFMGEWSVEERAALAAAVAEYKQLRPYLAGQRYILTGYNHQEWAAWQFVHPDGERIALLAFREGGEVESVRVQLREYHQNSAWALAAPADGVAVEGGIVTIALGPHGSALAWVVPG